jgi:hypothetical protein
MRNAIRPQHMRMPEENEKFLGTSLLTAHLHVDRINSLYLVVTMPRSYPLMTCGMFIRCLALEPWANFFYVFLFPGIQQSTKDPLKSWATRGNSSTSPRARFDWANVWSSISDVEFPWNCELNSSLSSFQHASGFDSDDAWNLIVVAVSSSRRAKGIFLSDF